MAGSGYYQPSAISHLLSASCQVVQVVEREAELLVRIGEEVVEDGRPNRAEDAGGEAIAREGARQQLNGRGQGDRGQRVTVGDGARFNRDVNADTRQACPERCRRVARWRVPDRRGKGRHHGEVEFLHEDGLLFARGQDANDVGAREGVAARLDPLVALGRVESLADVVNGCGGEQVILAREQPVAGTQGNRRAEEGRAQRVGVRAVDEEVVLVEGDDNAGEFYRHGGGGWKTESELLDNSMERESAARGRRALGKLPIVLGVFRFLKELSKPLIDPAP